MKEKRQDGVTIFHDKAGDLRLRVVVSGRITYSSTEGYKNRKDLVTAAVNSAQLILNKFNK